MRALVRLSLACALALLTASPATAGTRAPATGQVTVIQAAPGMNVDLAIDGRIVRKGVAVGKVLGPYRLSSGAHTVRFTQASGGGRIISSLKVRAGSNSDVVLHFPAARGGRPVVNSYKTPLRPIGPGKARILLAHTATVAPADVQFDGKTVFRDIANGEFADAEVPAGAHKVALTPTGVAAPPILGPLTVTLKQRTVTMVYAVGSPRNGSMKAIAHTVVVSPDGAVAPSTIKTGSAGLVADIRVMPFAASSTLSAASDVMASPAHRWLPMALRALRCGVGAAQP